MSFRAWAWLALILVVSLAAACGQDKGVVTPPSTGPTPEFQLGKIPKPGD